MYRMNRLKPLNALVCQKQNHLQRVTETVSANGRVAQIVRRDQIKLTVDLVRLLQLERRVRRITLSRASYSKQPWRRMFSSSAWKLALNASTWVLLAADSMLEEQRRRTPSHRISDGFWGRHIAIIDIIEFHMSPDRLASHRKSRTTKVLNR